MQRTSYLLLRSSKNPLIFMLVERRKSRPFATLGELETGSYRLGEKREFWTFATLKDE